MWQLATAVIVAITLGCSFDVFKNSGLLIQLGLCTRAVTLQNQKVRNLVLSMYPQRGSSPFAASHCQPYWIPTPKPRYPTTPQGPRCPAPGLTGMYLSGTLSFRPPLSFAGHKPAILSKWGFIFPLESCSAACLCIVRHNDGFTASL